MGATHVIQRGGIYHFRRAVPSDLLHLIGRTEIWKSTNSRRHHDAMILVRRWSAAFDQLIFQVRSGFVLDAEIKFAVSDFLRIMLEGFEARRAKWAERDLNAEELAKTYEEKQQSRLMALDRAQNLRMKLAVSQEDSTVTRLTDYLIRTHGFKLAPDTDQYREMRREVAAEYITMWETEAERAVGNYDTPYDLARRINAIADITSPPVESETPVLSELIEPYLIAKNAEKKLQPQTISDKRRAIQQFVLIVEDKPTGQLIAGDIHRYLDAMRKLPASPATSDKFKDKTIPEMLAMAVEDSERQAEGTIDKKYKEIKTFCRWLKSNKHNPDVVTDEIRFVISDGQKASDKKNAYEVPVDLEMMAIGLVAVRIKFNKKGVVVPNKTFLDRPERHWVPLLATFSGFRLEEACQLLTTDIIKIDGIWCANCDWYDDNGNAVKRLKNINAKRIQPLHQTLLDLGFLEFWNQMKVAKHERLFHRLTPNKTTGKLQANFASWYNGHNGLTDYNKLKAPGFERIFIDDDPLKSFHSTRHTFCTALGHTDINDRMLSDLMGHSKATIAGKTYTKEQLIKAKAEEINGIDYGVDFVGILGHWDDWH